MNINMLNLIVEIGPHIFEFQSLPAFIFREMLPWGAGALTYHKFFHSPQRTEEKMAQLLLA